MLRPRHLAQEQKKERRRGVSFPAPFQRPYHSPVEPQVLQPNALVLRTIVLVHHVAAGKPAFSMPCHASQNTAHHTVR